MFARSHNTRQVCYQSSDLTNNQRGTGCLHSTHPDDHGKIDPNCAGFIFDFFLSLTDGKTKADCGVFLFLVIVLGSDLLSG